MVGFMSGTLKVRPEPRISLAAQRSIVLNTTRGPLPTLLGFQRSSESLGWQSTGPFSFVQVNQPRFADDPVSGAGRGLWIEAEATNLVSHSIASTGTWLNDNCSSVDAGLTTHGPFQGVVVQSSGATWGRLKQDFTLTTGDFAVTCYYVPGTSPRVRATISGQGVATIVGGAHGNVVTFRSDIGPCSNIEDVVLSDGVTRRLRYVFHSTAEGTFQIGLGPQSAIVGEDIIVLGIQVEQGTTFSSFVETGSVQGIRAADQLLLDGPNGTFEITVDFADRPTQVIPQANVSPGYVIPVETGRIEVIRLTRR